MSELPERELSEALALLSQSEFIHEKALYPVAEYEFKHPLTQEVALNSQLREHRARTHAAVARAIEEAYPQKLTEKSAELAHHWEEAGDNLPAARWHRRAAEWLGPTDRIQSVAHWSKVRELVLTWSRARQGVTQAQTGRLEDGRSNLEEARARGAFPDGARASRPAPSLRPRSHLIAPTRRRCVSWRGREVASERLHHR